MKKVKEMIEWNNKTILTCFKKQSKIAVNVKDRMDFRKEMSKDDKTFQNTSKISQNDTLNCKIWQNIKGVEEFHLKSKKVWM